MRRRRRRWERADPPNFRWRFCRTDAPLDKNGLPVVKEVPEDEMTREEMEAETLRLGLLLRTHIITYIAHDMADGSLGGHLTFETNNEGTAAAQYPPRSEGDDW